MTTNKLLTNATPTTYNTRLKNNRHLRLLRILWWAVLVVGLTLYVLGLPRYYDSVLTSGRYAGYLPLLERMGLSIEFIANYLVGLDIFASLFCTSIAIFLYFQRSNDWLVLLISQTIFFLGFSFSLSIAQLHPVIGAFVAQMGFVMLIVPMTYFPDGTLKPAWFRWLNLVAVPYFIITLPVQISALDISDGAELPATYGLAVLGAILLVVLLAAGQVVRYYKFATPVQKQQTKFVVFSGVLGLICDVLVWLSAVPEGWAHPYATTESIAYTAQSLTAFLIAKPLDTISWILLPIGFALAITRTRLWDVDLVINRSLVYGVVTVALGAVFVAVSLLIQNILGESQSTLALVLSVVIAGALFNPTRRQVQNLVDRRLYGFRFDLIQLEKAQNLKPAIQNAGLLTGKMIGEYELLGILGKGGMGEVYKGYKADSSETLAVKVLPQLWTQDKSARERFIREAEMVSKLRHPNIVHVYAHGAFEDTYFIVMELILGVELSKYLKEHGEIPVEDLETIAFDVADALDYAHSQRLVHRDLKPSNIMLKLNEDKETYRAILLDFGVAKLEDSSERLTGTGAIGTIDYMAPEQIKEAKAVDHRADIYAMGVMFFEILAGQRPFSGTPAQVMFAHLQQPAPDIRDIKPEIPRHIAHALNRALAKEPEMRWNNASEFVRALFVPN